MKSLKKCPICGNNNFNFLYQQLDKNLGISGSFSLFKCKKCLAVFLNPQPDCKESEKFYPKKDYYSLDKIKTKKDSIKTKIKLKLYRIYFMGEKNIFKKIIFSPINFLIRGVVIKKGVKLLDIGCGSGQFLYEMKSLGLDVYGVEPGKFDEYGNTKYDLHIKKGDIDHVKYKKEYFDLITLNHVLEHIIDPNKTLFEIKGILKRNGIFILGVPNTASLAFKIFGKNWLALDVPRHLINYSAKNLKFLLEKNGFKIIKTRYNSRPSQYVVSLFYALNFNERLRNNRFLLGIFNLFFLPLTYLANIFHFGDQIEVYCKKK